MSLRNRDIPGTCSWGILGMGRSQLGLDLYLLYLSPAGAVPIGGGGGGGGCIHAVV